MHNSLVVGGAGSWIHPNTFGCLLPSTIKDYTLDNDTKYTYIIIKLAAASTLINDIFNLPRDVGVLVIWTENKRHISYLDECSVLPTRRTLISNYRGTKRMKYRPTIC